MTIFEHWQLQKESLRPQLTEVDELAAVTVRVRHALMQTEQNALADLADEVLRQQASVLMACLKNSLNLLEVPVAARVWVPQERRVSSAGKTLWICSSILLLLLLALCSWKKLWLGVALSLCVLIIAVAAKITDTRSALRRADETRLSWKPDADRLFALLDSQLRAVDRYLTDFQYLNDQLKNHSSGTDSVSVSHAADLLEALYECDEEQRANADEAAKRLLESLGLCALDYTAETSRLFNALPSKNVTRTLSPAIVSAKDQQLLKRGVAAVQIGAA